MGGAVLAEEDSTETATGEVITVGSADELQTALSSESDSYTIKFTSDITISYIDINKSLTIDLDKHTLDGRININNGEDVVIKNGTVTSNSSYVIQTNSNTTNVKIEGLSVIGEDKTDAKGVGGIQFNGVGNVDIIDSVIKAGDVYMESGVKNGGPEEGLDFPNSIAGNININIVSSEIISGGVICENEITENKIIMQKQSGVGISFAVRNSIIKIKDTKVYSGNNDIYNSDDAINITGSSSGSEFYIDDSSITGGDGGIKTPFNFGIGGNALRVQADVSIEINNSTLTGGNGGKSWGGNALQIQKENTKKISITDSTLLGAAKGKGQGAAIFSSSGNVIDISDSKFISKISNGYGAIKGQVIANVSGDIEITGKVDGEFMTIGDATVQQRTSENEDFTDADYSAAASIDWGSYYGTLYYRDLNTAISEAEDYDITIKLVNNSSLDNTEVEIASNQNITLDLNGFNVNGNVDVHGNLTVKDSTADAEPIVGEDHSTVTYKSGKILGNVFVYNNGVFTLESGKIEVSNGKSGLNLESGSKADINGGYIEAQECGVGVFGEMSLTINGGVIKAKDNAALAGNGSKDKGYEGTNVVINGGTLIGNIQSDGYVACGIYQPQDGTLVMNGGTIYANGGVGILTRNGKVTINGGTINTTGNVNGYVGDAKNVVGCKAVIFDQKAHYENGEGYTKAETHINGGTFNSEAEPLEVIKDDIQTPYVFEVTGGKFSSDVSEYVSPGYYFDKIDSTVKKGETNVKDTAQAVTTTVKLEGLEKNLRDQQDKTGYDSSKADKYEVVVTSPSEEDKKAAEYVKPSGNNVSREMYDIRVNKISGGTVTEVNLTNQKVTITLGKAVAENTTPTVIHIGNGVIEGIIGVEVSADRKSITFTASSFSTFIVDAQYAYVDAESITDSINVNFENANVSGTRAEYDIVLNAESGKTINEFVSSQFVFDKGGDTVSYEIQPSEFVNMTVNGDKYEFNMDGKSYSSATGNKIVLGKLIITGTGDYNFTVDTSGNKDKIQVHTTKVSDNIVNDYTAAGSTVKFEGNGYDNSNDGGGAKSEASGTLKPATKDLTVNVAFPNAVENKDTKYQDMKVKVSGGDLAEPIEISLGNDYTAPANTSVAWDDTSDIKYVVKVNDTLTENTVYNVEVSGAGYRTYRYNVNMGDSNKSINVWNNVKDVAASVEEGKFETNTTFLAGDIVADNTINIYDLSAVVSYFGTTGLNASNYPQYAKYDLNRDGKIDSKDIAYVLVSWGN